MALLQALRSKSFFHEYVSVLCFVYDNQLGSVNRRSACPIQLGVNQGGVLRAMFFNFMLDGAFDIAYIPSSRTNIHRSSISAIDKYTIY